MNIDIKACQLDKDIEKIKRITCKGFGVSVDDIESSSRKQELVRVRNIAMKRCREAGATLEAIGKAFNRNHSTVLHSLNNQYRRKGKSEQV